MTREEAIACLDELGLSPEHIMEIVEALEQDPCDDAISRANTIDEVSRIIFDHPLDGYEDGQLILKTIQDMPSVSPADDNCQECKKDWTKCGKCPVTMKWVKEHRRDVKEC